MKITVNVEKNEIEELIKGYIKDNLNMDVNSMELTADGAIVVSETKKENKPTSNVKKDPKEDKEEESVSSILGTSEDEDTESETEESKVTEGQTEIASLFS